MLKRLLLTAVFTLPYITLPAVAQNTTCPTRAPGDSTNACASTAFVNSEISHNIPLPLSIANGGTGTSTPGLTAGANIVITGTWPNNTIAGSGGAGTGVVASGLLGQGGYYLSNGTTISGATSPCNNIVAFGGSTGASDNTAAFAAAAVPNATGQVCVEFPPGIFNFTAAQTVNLQSPGQITVRGAGQDVTVLKFAANVNGFNIAFADRTTNSFHIQNLSVVTLSSGTNTAIGFNLAQTINLAGSPNVTASDFTNVAMHGADGYGLADYWDIAVNTNGISRITFNNVNCNGPNTPQNPAGYITVGICVNIVSGSSNNPAVVFNFNNASFNDIGTGILYGDYTQGVAITNSNFTGDDVGILGRGPGLVQLAVTTSQFNCANFDILTQATAIQGVILEGNLFFIAAANASAIQLEQANSFNIIGNDFIGPGPSVPTNGLVVLASSGTWPGSIVGNAFTNFQGSAINLFSATAHINVQSNSYFANTANVSNAGTNTIGGGSP